MYTNQLKSHLPAEWLSLVLSLVRNFYCKGQRDPPNLAPAAPTPWHCTCHKDQSNTPVGYPLQKRKHKASLQCYYKSIRFSRLEGHPHFWGKVIAPVQHPPLQRKRVPLYCYPCVKYYLHCLVSDKICTPSAVEALWTSWVPIKIEHDLCNLTIFRCTLQYNSSPVLLLHVHCCIDSSLQ